MASAWLLSSRDVVNPTFTAPRELTADVVLSFRLLVTDPGGRFDTDTVEVTVTVTDENPGKPLAPTVSAATPYSLMVEWMEPENTGPAITDYDVQYREGGSGDGFTDAQHRGTARTATLTGLMPDTVYEVQVRATNATGTGDWSESGEEKTKTLQTGESDLLLPSSCRGSELANHDYLYQLLPGGGDLSNRFHLRSRNSADGLVCRTGNG